MAPDLLEVSPGERASIGDPPTTYTRAPFASRILVLELPRELRITVPLLKPSPPVMAQAISQTTETVSLTCSEPGATTGVGTAAPRAASENCCR